MSRSKSTGEEVVIDLDYVELPSQKQFHECLATFKGLSGGVGSGKSRALCYEALRLSWENRGRMGLLGAPTFPMLRAATQATLFEIMEQHNVPFQFNKSENMLTLTQWDESKILFRPVEEFERLRGTNLAWFGIEDAWLRLEARLRDPVATRKCGFAVWTPKGFDWVYYKFVAETKHNSYVTVFAKPLENDHVGNDYYERLKNSYDEAFYRQEVLGEYLAVSSGVVYRAFSRDAHVTPVSLDSHTELLWSVDINVNPMCSVVAQRFGDMVRVLDEIVLTNASTEDACKEFLRRYSRHRAGLKVYGDASAHHQQTSSGWSDFDVIKREIESSFPPGRDFRIPKSNPTVRERVNLTNAKLRSAAGDVELVVDPKCKQLIMDFEQVVWKEGTNSIDKDKDKKRTHLSDALGYLLWQEFPKKPPVGEQSQRLTFC
jgi:Terminase large subunit, T4likevirus-type, N-terminal